MKIELFIKKNGEGYERIELFDDENITYRGKLIDSQDINALFNDFINTFSIPSTPITDAVFKYWFEIGVDGGFNPNKRVDAFIQVNTIPLRIGKVQLEDVVTRGEEILNYQITMYGEITGLDDVFGDDELSSLDLSNYDFGYNQSNIEAALQFPSLMTLNKGFNDKSDIVMPLIVPTDREIQYNRGNTDGDVLDISRDEGRLDIRNLRPSIRQIRIIEAIENKYGITFSREFLNQAAFLNSYMWLNGQEEFDDLVTFEDVVIDNGGTFSPDGGDLEISDEGLITITRDFNNYEGSITTGEVYDYLINFQFEIKNVSDTGKLYTIQIVDTINDEVINQFKDQSGNITYSYTNRTTIVADNNLPRFLDRYKVQITTQGNLDLDIDTTIITQVNSETTTIADPTTYRVDNISYNFNSGFSVAKNLPEMKVGDYIKNLVKQYKLIIRPTSTTNFRLINIYNYFQNGNILDFTQYVDNEEDVENSRYKTYRDINFNFQVTETAPQEAFKRLTGRYRGNSIKEFDVDNKNSLDISLDFEVPPFARLLNTAEAEPSDINIAIYQGGDAEDAEFPENPLIHYYNGITSLDVPIKVDYLSSGFDNEENGEVVANATIISCDFITVCDTSDSTVFDQVNNNFDYSNTTINSWHTQPIQENLYTNYYKEWLDLIYDNDTRISVFSCKNVPYSLISELELDSSIVIGNQKYNIEEYEINLLTGDVEFRLFPSKINILSLIPLRNGNTNAFYNAGGGWDSIDVESNLPITFQPSDTSWVENTPVTLPAGKHTLSWYIKNNATTSQRLASLEITSGGKTLTISITQRKS